MGATPTIAPFAQDYVRLILIAAPIMCADFTMNQILRYEGKAALGMVALMCGCALNIALDALFIVGLGWGIRGGAWATTIAMAFSAGLAVMHFLNPKSFIRFKRHCWEPKMYIVKNILAIGISPFSMNVAACAVVALLNSQLIHYGGDLAVSAYGVVNRVAMLVVMILLGICQGMQPIAGYNYGAGNNLRLKHVYMLSLKWNVGIGVVGMLLALIIPRLLVMMMSDNEQLIAISIPAMRYLLVMAPLIGFTITNSQFFQSIDKPWIAIVTSLSRQVIFLIPMMYLVPLLYMRLGGDGLSGVWCSCTVSDLLGAVLSGWLLLSQRKVFVPGYIPPERKPRKERGPSGTIIQ
jgi:Na+-driven multidrug efflux pump